MSLYEHAKYWNTTLQERKAVYPCDGYLAVPSEDVLRAIDVAAPSETVFRWLCQMKVAPYSYDWLDNPGRRSPTELSPGAEELERGQVFMIFKLLDYETNHHLSGVILKAHERLFGPIAISYCVTATSPHTSRLIVKMNVGASGLWARARRRVLVWGDLIMMRKQLLTLKERAEESAERADVTA